MSNRFKFRGVYHPHYLRHWREFRGVNLLQMTELIAELDAVSGGLSKASLSRIERGLTPYTRDVLEVYAQICQCEPSDLLTRPPTDPEGIWRIWNRLHGRDRARACAMIEAVFFPD